MIQFFRLRTLCRSSPVSVRSKKLEGKVSTEIISKGYCSTKNMYYYGMKLYVVRLREDRNNTFPEEDGHPPSEYDLSVFKSEYVPYLKEKTVFADKIYSDFSFFDEENPARYFPQRELRVNQMYSNKGKKPPENYSHKLFPKSDNPSNHFSTD